MSFRILVPRAIYDAMLVHALAEQPNECCGLLAGVVEEGAGRVTVRYPLVNALGSATRYESEPRTLFQAHRDMRERGLEVLAVYHSHPSSLPIPSKTDLERNWSEDAVNLIVGQIWVHGQAEHALG